MTEKKNEQTMPDYVREARYINAVNAISLLELGQLHKIRNAIEELIDDLENRPVEQKPEELKNEEPEIDLPRIEDHQEEE